MNSSTKVILKDDCYLLQILSKTHRKTQKLERYYLFDVDHYLR